jgi:chromosome segregation ATPase
VLLLETTLKKTFHQEFAEITEQIKRLEDMRIENQKQIRKLQSNNKSLTETIEQLKTKRSQLVFLDSHISER